MKVYIILDISADAPGVFAGVDSVWLDYEDASAYYKEITQNNSEPGQTIYLMVPATVKDGEE